MQEFGDKRMFYNTGIEKGCISKTLNLGRNLFLSSPLESQIFEWRRIQMSPKLSYLKNLLQVGRLTSVFHAVI